MPWPPPHGLLPGSAYLQRTVRGCPTLCIPWRSLLDKCFTKKIDCRAQPRLYGAERYAQLLGDLAVRVSLEINEVDDLLVFAVQFIEHFADTDLLRIIRRAGLLVY